MPRGTTWSIEAMTAMGKSTLIARWLQSHNAIRVELGPGLAPKTLRADFATLPAAWETLAANRLLHHIDLTPDGTASLFLESRDASVAASVAGLAAGQPVRAREMLAGANQAKVTRRQMDALLTAVALGYYDIPHRLDLRTLAAAMGCSLGSVSELLRRAERAVLNNFADSFAVSRWHEETPRAAPQLFAGGPHNPFANGFAAATPVVGIAQWRGRGV